MVEVLTELPIKETDLIWEEKYPRGINFGDIYGTQINKIDQAKDEKTKSQLRTEIVDEVYKEHFKNMEKDKTVFFNAEIPKKDCIPGMLRQLFDKFVEVLKFDKEILADLKTVSGEAIVDFIEHDKLRKTFPLKMRINQNQIQILVGSPNLTEKISAEEFLMPDPLADRGRGMPIMAALSDHFEVRSNKEKNDYAFLIVKNLRKEK